MSVHCSTGRCWSAVKIRPDTMVNTVGRSDSSSSGWMLFNLKTDDAVRFPICPAFHGFHGALRSRLYLALHYDVIIYPALQYDPRVNIGVAFESTQDLMIMALKDQINPGVTICRSICNFDILNEPHVGNSHNDVATVVNS